MCRLAAYLGPEITLAHFLLQPRHNLLVQARHPQELRYTTVNADGFGYGWYAADQLPAAYTSPLPIWSDVNLPDLGRSLRSDLWLATVRSALPGMSTTHANTQPFRDDELLFMHNGFITDFALRVRPVLRQFLDPEIEADVHGTTDSEYLFAVLRHLLADDPDMSIEESLSETCKLLEDWLDELPALLNVVVSDGERLYALRHAVNDECPSLYYTVDDELFPGGQLLASERLTDSEFWQPVPEHHILILDTDEPPELLAL